MWIKFNRDFKFIPPDNRAVTLSYKAGNRYNVTRVCAERAIAENAAEESSNPRRDSDNGSSDKAQQSSQIQEAASLSTERPADEGSGSGSEEREGDAGGSPEGR